MKLSTFKHSRINKYGNTLLAEFEASLELSQPNAMCCLPLSIRIQNNDVDRPTNKLVNPFLVVFCLI